MRLNFYEIFKVNPDLSLIPKQTIRIGGVTMNEKTIIAKGTAFGGINLSLFIGRDFSVKKDGETLVLKGIY